MARESAEAWGRLDDADAENLGVSTALERTCALESRLRQAIQETHPLTGSYDRDPVAADREREALLAVTEQMELLEDKLRDYWALDDRQFEDKTVTLSQLDSLRRELIAITRNALDHVIFAKDVVREVLAFAEMSGDPPPGAAAQSGPSTSSTTSESPYRPLPELSPERSQARHLLAFTELPSEPLPPPPQQRKQQDWRMEDAERWHTNAEADRIIYESDAGARSATGPMLSPARVRDEQLYATTNGSSLYRYDPQYGGKVSMSRLAGRDAEAAAAAAADDAGTKAPSERPRVRELFGPGRPRRGTENGARSEDDASSISARTWSHVSPPGALSEHTGARSERKLSHMSWATVPPPPPAEEAPQRRRGGGRFIRRVAKLALAAAAVAGGVKAAEVLQQQAETAPQLQWPWGGSAKHEAEAHSPAAASETVSLTADGSGQHYNLFPALPPPKVTEGLG